MSYATTRTCPGCGRDNRIPASHLADNGRCGACKQPLPALSEPLDVEGEELADIVREARVPVLIDFWASWCSPCRMVAPEVRKVAAETAGKALVLKVNTEESPELAAQFGVSAIPNFVVMRGGKALMQQAGMVNHHRMRTWLERASQVN
jgi:thioredoxin 2